MASRFGLFGAFAVLLVSTVNAASIARPTVEPCIRAYCFVDPCSISKGCPAYPDAVCDSNYCGGCHAYYYVGGKRVNCAVTAPVETEKPIVTGACPMPTSHGLCAEMCQNCEARGQLCCSNGCGHQCMDPVKEDTAPLSVRTDIPTGFHLEEGCPPHGINGACVVSCASHDECGDSHRCCSTGCGRVCKPLYLGNKTESKLSCPLLSSGQIGSCIMECSADSHCGDGEKCCSNGCGHTCQKGVMRPTVPQVEEVAEVGKRDFSVKYSCPKMEDDGTVGICISNCETDDDCNGGSSFMNNGTMKCCSNGCGKICVPGMKPIKLGSCPPDPLGGPCFMTCETHEHCEDELLCCSNGCGKECKPPHHRG